MAGHLRRAPVAGDTVQLGPAVLVVREVGGGRITGIGLGLSG
jgi:NhaP-type Na+/H+ and K+/H+ antiporter